MSTVYSSNHDLWSLLNADTQELGILSCDAGETLVKGTTSLISLASTLEKNKSKLLEIEPLLEVAEPLIDVLNSPMIDVVGGLLPFGSIGIGHLY